MRTLLALLAAVALGVGGIGWYLGWYQVKTTTSPVTGHQNVNIDIDGGKIVKDVQRGEEKVHEVLQQKTQDTGTRQAENSSPDFSRQIPLTTPGPYSNTWNDRGQGGIRTP